MLSIAEARAKGLELVARPLKTKVTLPFSTVIFIVLCMVFTTHDRTVHSVSTMLSVLIIKPQSAAFSYIEPFHLLLVGDELKIILLS